jgi:hypothetical protein
MQCRVAPSLGGGFAGTVFDVWSVKPYTDETLPVVFFGMYGFPDFHTFWKHKGEKAILWAGSDIRHLVNGYWLDEAGSIRLSAKPIAKYLKQFKNYVENEVEAEALRKYGIDPEVIPSFLGDAKSYQISYNYSQIPRVYTSVSGDDFKLYGWDKVEFLAKQNPNIEFHLYGNTKPWKTENKNVIVHGRVSQETMNREVAGMQGALRLVPFDGFSEILAKSVLWGQWPISEIPYPHMLSPEQIGQLSSQRLPNVSGRDYYLKTLNQYPWK